MTGSGTLVIIIFRKINNQIIISPVVHCHWREVHLMFGLKGHLPGRNVEQTERTERRARGEQRQLRLLTSRTLSIQNSDPAVYLQGLEQILHLFNLVKNRRLRQ